MDSYILCEDSDGNPVYGVGIHRLQFPSMPLGKLLEASQQAARIKADIACVTADGDAEKYQRLLIDLGDVIRDAVTTLSTTGAVRSEIGRRVKAANAYLGMLKERKKGEGNADPEKIRGLEFALASAFLGRIKEFSKAGAATFLIDYCDLSQDVAVYVRESLKS